MTTRKQRGLKERIYLLDAKLDDNLVLSVKGSSNRIYEITFSKEFTKCKCMDFSIRKKVCAIFVFSFNFALLRIVLGLFSLFFSFLPPENTRKVDLLLLFQFRSS